MKQTTMQTDSVANYTRNRTWGVTNGSNGSALYLFGKIRCEPNIETIREMITKVKETYKKAVVEHKDYFITVTRTNSNEQINFVPREDNPNMAKRMSSQNKNNSNQVYFGWHSQYQIREDQRYREQEENEGKEIEASKLEKEVDDFNFFEDEPIEGGIEY